MAKIILKYDDLTEENCNNFYDVYKYLLSNKIQPSFGIVGCSLNNPSNNYLKKISSMKEHNVEIWNHGFSHAIEEFSKNDYNKQFESINRTQQLLKQKCGIECVTFGSPFNNSSVVTESVLYEKFPEIKNYFFIVSSITNKEAKTLLLRCNYEKYTGKVNVPYFMSEYKRVGKYPYFVLQGHPGKWTDRDFVLHREIIEILLKDGHEFVTPAVMEKNNSSFDFNNKMCIELLNYMKKYKNIAFYGAGATGREFYKFANKVGKRPDCFVVSDEYPFGSATLYETPVYTLKQFAYLYNANDTGIILTMYEAQHNEVIQNLKIAGYNNIWLKYRDEEYAKLVDYIRYSIC